jgi:hypothetical protein
MKTFFLMFGLIGMQLPEKYKENFQSEDPSSEVSSGGCETGIKAHVIFSPPKFPDGNNVVCLHNRCPSANEICILFS